MSDIFDNSVKEAAQQDAERMRAQENSGSPSAQGETHQGPIKQPVIRPMNNTSPTVESAEPRVREVQKSSLANITIPPRRNAASVPPAPPVPKEEGNKVPIIKPLVSDSTASGDPDTKSESAPASEPAPTPATAPAPKPAPASAPKPAPASAPKPAPASAPKPAPAPTPTPTVKTTPTPSVKPDSASESGEESKAGSTVGGASVSTSPPKPSVSVGASRPASQGQSSRPQQNQNADKPRNTSSSAGVKVGGGTSSKPTPTPTPTPTTSNSNVKVTLLKQVVAWAEEAIRREEQGIPPEAEFLIKAIENTNASVLGSDAQKSVEVLKKQLYETTSSEPIIKNLKDTVNKL